MVIKDKTQLRQFLTSIFLMHLASIRLSKDETELLSLLAAYSPLPLPVLADVLGLNYSTLNQYLIRLIDLALIITTETGYYRISDPVTDSAISAFGYPEMAYHEALAEALSDYLKDTILQGPALELSGVMFRAAKFSGKTRVANTVVHLASDLIELTETLYHERRYKEAIKIGYSAIEQRPENVSARSYLIRALIQQEIWVQAEEQLQLLQKYAPLRDIKFLYGFLERKRTRYINAIAYYKEAERLGRGDAGIFRELALCYFLTGKQVEATHYIETALTRHRDNRFVIDLWAKIATRRRDEKMARQALSQLERVDKPIYYHHRLSSIELAFGHNDQAKDAAEKAFNESDKPPFEVWVQLIACKIATKDLDEADELLLKLKDTYGNIRRDIQVGLRCRIEIERGHYGIALDQSERIVDKNLYYKAIRRDALSGELEHSALSDKVRAEYQKELINLQRDLADQSIDLLIPFDFDMT
jgi:tetratricopeptide (TPR) repeat protein